jgi:hypothetical protein
MTRGKHIRVDANDGGGRWCVCQNSHTHTGPKTCCVNCRAAGSLEGWRSPWLTPHHPAHNTHTRTHTYASPRGPATERAVCYFSTNCHSRLHLADGNLGWHPPQSRQTVANRPDSSGRPGVYTLWNHSIIFTNYLSMWIPIPFACSTGYFERLLGLLLF